MKDERRAESRVFRDSSAKVHGMDAKRVMPARFPSLARRASVENRPTHDLASCLRRRMARDAGLG